jgi:predicted ATPase
MSSMSGRSCLSTREIKETLASWTIHHYVSTSRDSVIRMPSVATFSKRVAPDAQNLISVLHTLYSSNRDFEREVDAAMAAAFGDEYVKLVFPPDADQRVQLRIRWKSLTREQSAADLSDGTLRFLFLLGVLGNPNPPPVIAIDEPDIGLHPGMLPIIAEYATAAATRAQVILTTHSPAFLDAFRESTPTITVVGSTEGKTHLQVLSGEKFAYWLKQYTGRDLQDWRTRGDGTVKFVLFVEGYTERKKIVYGNKLFDRLDPSVAHGKCPYLARMLDEMLWLRVYFRAAQ